MSAQEPTLLRLSGLSKRYPGVVALDGVDVTIEAGEVLGLVGKNGAGKSTLIKSLAGVTSPDAGEIAIDGRIVKVRGPGAARELGLSFVHQEINDIPNLTVAENIHLGLGYPRAGGAFVNGQELRSSAVSTLQRLGVDLDPDARVGALSTAQRRMVMIARGIAAQARLLVLDEPTASLTDEEIVHLLALLRRLAEQGMAVVYVSHRLQEIFEVTDRVVVMRDGRVTHSGRTSALDTTELIKHITGHVRPTAGEQRRSSRTRGEVLLKATGLTSAKVRDANLTVHAGEVLGVAGLVGAGRTELARLLFGADRAAAGTVSRENRLVRLRGPRDAMRAGIVLLPEDRRHQGAVGSWSLRKNITLAALRQHRIGGRRSFLPVPHAKHERSAADRFMRRLGIKASHVDQPVQHLSGGNQQKVILAKWLNAGAEVFIFDEPTHGIDVDGKVEVYSLMEELADQRKGVVFISSEFAELVHVCDRVLVMREGQVVGEVAGDRITEQALVARCYAS